MPHVRDIFLTIPRLTDGIRLVATRTAISCAGLFVVSTLTRWRARSIRLDTSLGGGPRPACQQAGRQPALPAPGPAHGTSTAALTLWSSPLPHPGDAWRRVPGPSTKTLTSPSRRLARRQPQPPRTALSAGGMGTADDQCDLIRANDYPTRTIAAPEGPAQSDPHPGLSRSDSRSQPVGSPARTHDHYDPEHPGLIRVAFGVCCP